MSEEKTPLTDANEALAERVFERLSTAADFYNQPPAENEINLVQKTREVLAEAGVLNETLEAHYDNNRFILEAEGKHAHAQQFLLNRYFNDQFSSIDAEGGDSRLYRYQLMYEIKPTDWLKVLRESLAPNIASLGLPKV